MQLTSYKRPLLLTHFTHSTRTRPPRRHVQGIRQTNPSAADALATSISNGGPWPAAPEAIDLLIAGSLRFRGGWVPRMWDVDGGRSAGVEGWVCFW